MRKSYKEQILDASQILYNLNTSLNPVLRCQTMAYNERLIIMVNNALASVCKCISAAGDDLIFLENIVNIMVVIAPCVTMALAAIVKLSLKNV